MTDGGYTPAPPSRKQSPSSPRLKKKKPPPKKKAKKGEQDKGGVLNGAPGSEEAEPRRTNLGGRPKHSSFAMRDPSPLDQIDRNSSGWRAAAERGNDQDTLKRTQEVRSRGPAPPACAPPPHRYRSRASLPAGPHNTAHHPRTHARSRRPRRPHLAQAYMKSRLEDMMSPAEVQKEEALAAATDRGGPSLSKQEAARDRAIREENLNHYKWTKRDEEVAARGGKIDERKGPMYALSTESVKIREKETLKHRADLEASYVSTLRVRGGVHCVCWRGWLSRVRARATHLRPPRHPRPHAPPSARPHPLTRDRWPRSWPTRSGWRTTTRRWCHRTPRSPRRRSRPTRTPQSSRSR